KAWNIATSMGLGLSQCYGKSLPPENSKLIIYPNPSSNFLIVDIPENMPIQDVKCFNSRGRSVPVRLEQTETGNKLHFDLLSGIYYLKIHTTGRSHEGRFIVL